MRLGLQERIKDRCGARFAVRDERKHCGCCVHGAPASVRGRQLQLCHALPAPRGRSHRLRTYKRCFTGAAGVAWLIGSGAAADEPSALALANAMIQAGLLHHVAYEHTFKDGDLLYK